MCPPLRHVVPIRLPASSLVFALERARALALSIQVQLVIPRVTPVPRLPSSMATFRRPMAWTTLKTLCIMTGVRLRSGLLSTSSPGPSTRVWFMVSTRRLLLERALVSR